MLQNSFLQHLLFSSKGEIQGIEMEAEGSVLKYVAKALLENLHIFRTIPLECVMGGNVRLNGQMFVCLKCSIDGNGDSVQNLCVSSKVLIFVVEYKSNKNNGAYDATNIGIIFHISLLWRSF